MRVIRSSSEDEKKDAVDLLHSNRSLQESSSALHSPVSHRDVKDAAFHIQLGRPFILDVKGEQVELVFTAWVSEAFYFSHGWQEADENYLFLVLRVQARNMGRRLVQLEIMDKSIVLVDRGYEYVRVTHPCFGLRPEEAGTGYAVFEILSGVKPVKITWNDQGRNFIIHLRSQAENVR